MLAGNAINSRHVLGQLLSMRVRSDSGPRTGLLSLVLEEVYGSRGNRTSLICVLNRLDIRLESHVFLTVVDASVNRFGQVLILSQALFDRIRLGVARLMIWGLLGTDHSHDVLRVSLGLFQVEFL